MNEKEDILQSIPDEDLPKLRDLYKQDIPHTLYIYNFLNSTIKWKIQHPEENYTTIMAPHGKWDRGTFVAVYEWHTCEIYMCTLDKHAEILVEVIKKTKKIKWDKRMLLYTIHSNHYDTIMKALNKETGFMFLKEYICNFWWIPLYKALQLDVDCDSEVYINKLDVTHAQVINAYWSHKYEGTEPHIAFIIKMFGGYGVFLKSSNKLVAWILRNQIGMGMLHVLEECRRKGYATLVIKTLAKELAQEGVNAVVTVLTSNKGVQNMFSKVGFEKSDVVMYVESKGDCTYS